jgi:hypothetical protein
VNWYEYKPCGNPKILIEWLMAGGSMNDKHIPDVSIEVIKHPVTKKWKIYHRKCNPSDYPDYPHGMYAVGISDMQHLRIENTDTVITSNVYILAALIADFLNTNNHTDLYLAKSEVARLYAEAQKTFSVELKVVLHSQEYLL